MSCAFCISKYAFIVFGEYIVQYCKNNHSKRNHVKIQKWHRHFSLDWVWLTEAKILKIKNVLNQPNSINFFWDLHLSRFRLAIYNTHNSDDKTIQRRVQSCSCALRYLAYSNYIGNENGIKWDRKNHISLHTAVITYLSNKHNKMLMRHKILIRMIK